MRIAAFAATLLIAGIAAPAVHARPARVDDVPSRIVAAGYHADDPRAVVLAALFCPG